MAEHHDFDRNRAFLAEPAAELRIVHDDDVLPRMSIHDLLAGVGAAAALDEVELVAHLVCAVDANVDRPRADVVEQWDAESRGKLVAASARRDAHELSAFAD